MKKVAVLIALSLMVFGGRASAGDTLWLRIHGAGSTEAGTAVATIGADIYLAGTVTNLDADILLVKYRENGDSVWSHVRNFDTDEHVVGMAIAGDSGPVVCVAVRGPLPKLLLVKFNKNGDTTWTRSRLGFIPTGIALNALNEILVYGSSGGPSASDSLALAKYSVGGSTVFSRTWSLGAVHTTGGCALDPAGNLIGAVSVTGHPTLLKFSSIGDTLWHRQYPDLAGGELQGVAVAPNNCIVVADLHLTKLHVAKLAPDGSQLWTDTLPGQGAAGLYCNITVGADSNILAPLTDSLGVGGMMMLNAQGQRVWFSRSGRQCLLQAVAVGGDGYPVVVGRSNLAPPGGVIVKFSVASAIAEPANPSVSRAERFLVRDILGPGQAIALSVPRAGSYTISILTETGALLRQISKGYLVPGEFRLAPGKLAAGSYYLRIAGPAGTFQEKFIQLR
jgi:hypothetical protein